MKTRISVQTFMRSHTLAAVAAVALLFAPAATFAQITIGPGGVTVGPGHHGPGHPGFGGGGGGHDCAKWRHQCATEGRRCDRVQNFCGGMGRFGSPRLHGHRPRHFGEMGGAGNAQCRQWRFECETEGRRCGRVRDMC
jgi:hypothetical protein